MASTSEPLSTKRRLRKRRLPPLEPGPALQFVVANHPDQFRADKTMRHVRSHVMYKHRTEQKPTSSNKVQLSEHRFLSAYASNMPSSMMSCPEETPGNFATLLPAQSRPRSSTWTGSYPECIAYVPPPSTLRSLIYEIVSATTVPSARSAPPIFENALAFPFPGLYSVYQDPFHDLKQQYIDRTCFFCNGKLSLYEQGFANLKTDQQWMQSICADQTSFLSHISISCVYQDLDDGLLYDSSITTCAKTRVLSMVAGRLETNDATILSILHLLVSEVGAADESAFQVHYRGLQGLIHRRGGLSQLSDRLATYTIM